MAEITYRMTVYQRLSVHTDALLATDLRVEVAQPMAWVREHADQIAERGVNVARFGRPVALWLTQQGGAEHGAH